MEHPQGARHEDFCPETTGCQGIKSGKAERVSILLRGNVSTLGAGEECSTGYTVSWCACLSGSMPSVQADLSEPSGRDVQGRPDETVEVVCGDLLEAGIDLQRSGTGDGRIGLFLCHAPGNMLGPDRSGNMRGKINWGGEERKIQASLPVRRLLF